MLREGRGLNLSLEARRIFERAVDVPVKERQAFLDAQCSGRGDLMDQVKQMLIAFESVDDAPLAPLVALPSVGPTHSVEPFGGTARFFVQRQLGVGAFGTVYQVWDREQRARVAAKVLHSFNAAVLARFKREFRSAVELRHENLVRLYELFSEGEQWFYTMELVSGSTFLEYVRPQGGVSTARLRSAFSQLAHAVEALHRANRLHRDLKPANVLVTPEGRVVVLDFGLMRPAEVPVDKSVTMAGTPAYMAPEQLLQLPATAASDWYAVGVILHEALVGCRPSPDSDTRPVPEAKEVTADLCELCAAMLREHPGERPTGPQILSTIEACPRDSRETAIEKRPVDHMPFVGRTDILATLDLAFSQVQEDSLRVLLLEGQSGIGKSATIRHFLAESQKHYPDLIVLTGRCYEFETVPYKGLDVLIDELANYLHRLPEHAVEAVLPRDISFLPRLFPVLGGVRAISRAPARGAAVPDAQELRQRTFAALRELFTRLSDRHPVIVWIDDLQWGDRDSSTFLAELCAPPEQPNLLLILTYRSEDVGSNPTLRYLGQVLAAQKVFRTWQHFTLEPLSLDESRELLDALLPRDEQPSDDQVLREAAGHPLFLQELVASIRGAAPGEFKAEFPLRRLLQHRVAALGSFAREILEYASIATQPVSASLLFAAAENSNDAKKAEALSLLVGENLLRISDVQDDRRVEPYHDQVRVAVVEMLDPEVRRQRHAKLATALAEDPKAEPQVLVTHYLEAGELVRARTAAIAAAAKAEEQLAFDRAAACYQTVLKTGLEPQERSRIYRLLADALGKAGRGYDAAQAYLICAESDAQDCLALRCLAADQLMRSGHVDESQVLIHELAGHFGIRTVHNPSEAVVGMMMGRVVARWRLWTWRLRHRSGGSPVGGKIRERLELLKTAGVILTMADPVQSTYYQLQYVAEALRINDPIHLSAALSIEAGARAALGGENPGPPHALLDRAERVAKESKNANAIGFVQLCRAYVDYQNGHVPEGIEHAQAAVDYLREKCTGVAWELTAGYVLLFWFLCWSGRLERVRQLLPELLKEGAARGDVNVEVSLRLLSYTHYSYLSVDDPLECLDQSTRGLDRWSKSGFHLQHYGALCTRAETYLYMGDFARARNEVNQQWEVMSRSFILRWRILQIMALFLRGRVAMACWLANPADVGSLAEFESSAKGLEGIRSGWSGPTSNTLRAGLALGRGDLGAAKELLEKAYQGFEKIGLHGYAAAARYRCGALRGGPEGQQLQQQSTAFLDSQGVRNQPSLLQMFIPGDWERHTTTAAGGAAAG